MIEHKDPTFNSIAYLCQESAHSIYGIAAALELVGFYTWDKLGRFIYMSPKKDKNQHEKLCEDLLILLSEVNKGGYEFDEDYFYTTSPGLTRLEQSGWPDSDLPDFEKLESKWNQKYLGKKSKPLSLKSAKESDPATQSKAWGLIEGLIILKFGKDAPDDLRSKHSNKASMICNKLAVDANFTIDKKTLKKYLKPKI